MHIHIYVHTSTTNTHSLISTRIKIRLHSDRVVQQSVYKTCTSPAQSSSSSSSSSSTTTTTTTLRPPSTKLSNHPKSTMKSLIPLLRLAQRPLGRHTRCYTRLRAYQCQTTRTLTTTFPRQHPDPPVSSPPAPPSPPPQGGSTNFYRTHGRALFKALTLAFFSYQIIYWAWLTLETEEIKDQKTREIEGLEAQVRRLDQLRKEKA